MTTYNQIVGIFESIAENHLQIHSFDAGDLSDINVLNSELFVKMFLIPQNVTVRANTLEYSIRVMLFDKLNKDVTNERDILSDTLQISTDVVKIFKNSTGNLWITNDINLIPFSEEAADYVTGWYADYIIEVPFDSEYCSTNELVQNLDI